MDMESHCLLCFHSGCFLILASAVCCLSHSSLIGVHPLDENYYSSEVIKCKDGSKSFSRDRLNDNFCDCSDGTDEPDCCDGSDEYDGTIRCPNTCVMGGNAEYMNSNYNSKVSDLGSFAEKETKNGVKSEESVHNLTGLKLAIIVQVVLVIFLVFLWSFRCRTRSRRRRYH